MNLKYSMYNVFTSLYDKTIAYNALADKFLVLENELFEILQASMLEEDIDYLKNIHFDFYESLNLNGFIIANDIDEYAEIRNKILQTDSNKDEYMLIINPTMNCNFKCWYCYESHIKNSKMSDENIDRVCKFIYSLVSNGEIKKFNLSWFGGEPLLYFDKVILPILKYADSISEEFNVVFESDITTNGFLINRDVIVAFKNYKVVKTQITLDGNRELHNSIRNVSKDRGSYDEIISNIKLLCKNELHIYLRINHTKETLETITDIIDDLEDLTVEERGYLVLGFHQVWQTIDKENYLLDFKLYDIKNEFRKNGFNVSKSEGNVIENSCYADKANEAVINYNGEVFKCTARDFTNKNSEGVLNEKGEIEWNDIREKRLMAKLNNKPCQTCSILPLCGSGCSQLALESNGNDYCVHNFDEEKKKNVVKEYFIDYISN